MCDQPHEAPLTWYRCHGHVSSEVAVPSRLSGPVLQSWRAYVYLHKLGRIARDRKFEHWVWDDDQSRKCDRYRRAARRTLAKVRDLTGLEVHHIDGDCTNNAPSNLSALTPCQHARAHGRACKRQRN